MPKSTHPRALSNKEVVRVLRQNCFAIESVAHLRGHERLLLPICEKLREAINTLEPKEELPTGLLIPNSRWPFPTAKRV